jgi:hypothetical protein
MIRQLRSGRRFSSAWRQKRIVAILLAVLGTVTVCFAFATRVTSAPSAMRQSVANIPGLGGSSVRAAVGKMASVGEAPLPGAVRPPPPPAPAADKAGPPSEAPAAAHYVQPPAVHPTSGKPVRAKIITCPACRLNSLPLVKRFVKEQSQLFAPGLEIEYISGEDPRLHLYEGDSEVEDIDLSVRSDARDRARPSTALRACHGRCPASDNIIVHPRRVVRR